MLYNHPRVKLCVILNKYGRSVIDDPRYCRSLLTELAPHHRLEVSLLITALGQQVPQELLNPTALIPIAMQLERLAKCLHDYVGIQEDFAYWAVESWALALKVIHEPIPKQTVQSKPKTSPMPSKTTKTIPSSPASQQGMRKMKMITQKTIIENSNIPAELIKAVVKQSGGFQHFSETAPDVVEHGGDGGCNVGFIWYKDTVAFTRKNKNDILELARAQAAKKNITHYQLLADLKEIKEANISPDELAEIINRLFKEDEKGKTTQVFNTLALWSLEKVAQAWVDLNSKVYPPVPDTSIDNKP